MDALTYLYESSNALIPLLGRVTREIDSIKTHLGLDPGDPNADELADLDPDDE
jgi:hypothetical protein